VRVPLAWYLSQHTPLAIKGIWIAMALGFTVTGVVGYLYYVYGGWRKAAAKIQMPMEKPIDAILEA
jgi:Na+-driven multidrug efflux pump